jgi:hypothetical protein
MDELRAMLDEMVELNRLYDDPELGKQQRILYARHYLRTGAWSLLPIDNSNDGQMEFFADLPALVAVGWMLGVRAYVTGDRRWVSEWSHRLSEVVGLDEESFSVPPSSLADVPI